MKAILHGRARILRARSPSSRARPPTPRCNSPSGLAARCSPARTASSAATSRAARTTSSPSTPAIGGAFVQLTLTQRTFGKVNELQLSSSNIENLTAAPLTVTLLASDTGFLSPVRFVNNSGSLTFNSNVGAPNSTLSFFADTLNRQGANPTNTPGVLLETVMGHALTDPDSFSGSLVTPFDASAPFSMTEGGSLVLRADGSVTGFNQAMESGVPEPSTWAMLIIGFAAMAWAGLRRAKSARFAL